MTTYMKVWKKRPVDQYFKNRFWHFKWLHLMKYKLHNVYCKTNCNTIILWYTFLYLFRQIIAVEAVVFSTLNECNIVITSLYINFVFFLVVEQGHRDLIWALKHSNRSTISWNMHLFQIWSCLLGTQMTLVSSLYDHLHENVKQGKCRAVF